MKKRILVIEDEEHINELIKFNLENNGYEVISAFDGLKGMELAVKEKPDLLLLDVMLPKMDGVEVCNKLKNREDTEDIPIIMLTAKAHETDKVLGLEIGADDYMTKPFSTRELLARIKVILKRYEKTIKKETSVVMLVGDLRIDNEKHEVTKEGESIYLTLKEFQLLRILTENRGKVLSRNVLLDEVWGYDYFGESRTVDVHVRHLRKKIGDNNGELIETIRGVGYKIK